MGAGRSLGAWILDPRLRGGDGLGVGGPFVLRFPSGRADCPRFAMPNLPGRPPGAVPPPARGPAAGPGGPGRRRRTLRKRNRPSRRRIPVRAVFQPVPRPHHLGSQCYQQAGYQDHHGNTDGVPAFRQGPAKDDAKQYSPDHQVRPPQSF